MTDSSSNDLSLWQAVRKYQIVMLYCLALSSAVLLYGYDQAIVGSVSGLPAFQRDFGERLAARTILPSVWLALWNIGTPIGVMGGAFFGGCFQDRVGRKIVLALGSTIAAMGVAVMFACYLAGDVQTRRSLFLGGKVVQGMGIGMMIAVAQTYMSEVLPTKLRGPTLSFLTIFTLLGQLAGAVVVYNSINLPGTKSYTVCFASQWPFSLATFMVSLILPESPTYLIKKNKIDLAYKAQARLNERNAHTASNIERLRLTINEERRTGMDSTYVECFQGNNRCRTNIVIFASVIPQAFGLTLLAKGSYFLQIVGMPAKLSVMLVIVGIAAGLIANVCSFWTLSRFGRRPLIIVSLVMACIIWMTVGIAGCFDGKPTIWYTGACMVAIGIICGLGCWPASCVVAAEVSSLNLRGMSQGIGWFTAAFAAGLMGFILPYLFNPDQGDLGARTGFVYGGLSAIAAFISWLTIPEMKGRSCAELDTIFSQNVSARDFEKYTVRV